MNEMLEAALHYAELGIAVFPLVPRTKEPYKDSHGLLDATTDAGQIRKWWADAPDSNIGACTNGFVVLDVDYDEDKGEDGYEFLREWEKEHGELPETATAITGRGGMHIWYRTDKLLKNSVNAGKGIDVRSQGGFVVMPGSVHPNGGRYEWENHPDDYAIADADKSVYELVEAVRPRRRGRPSAKAPKGGVSEGGRNDYLYKLGCSLRADEKNDDDLIAAMLEIHNKNDCKPPLEQGELDKIVWSVLSLPRGFSDEVKEAKRTAQRNGRPRKFDHAAIGDQLMADCGACFVDGMPAIRNGEVFAVGWNAVDAEIIKRVKDATRANQNEVHHYLTVLAERKRQSPPNLIAFENGVLDIETMELRGWEPGDVIPNIVPHWWNPDAENPEVDSILLKMAAGDADVYQNLMEVMGVCLYRSAEFGQSAILLGCGSNGKSTYISMLLAMLGEDNVSSLDMGMIGKQFHTGRLVGKLANLGDDISNEFQHGDLLSIFKKVVTGNRLYADVKGTEGFEFTPYCQMVFSANEFPRLADYADGMMRRIFPIEFNAVFRRTDPDYDPRIVQKVTTEAACERMCVLAVGALRNVIAQNGFSPNAASTRRVEEIKADNDTVLAWVVDGSWDASSLCELPIANYYQSYKEWAIDNGLQAVKRTKFTRSVNAKLGLQVGQKSVNGKTARVFVKA